MKIEDLSLFLTKVSLFKGLNPDKIAKCLTEADFKIKEYKKNEIVFFDKNYRYMVVRYNNGTTKVFSRYPNNEKISLEDKELDEFEKIVGNNNNLKNVFYDIKIKNIREIK